MWDGGFHLFHGGGLISVNPRLVDFLYIIGGTSLISVNHKLVARKVTCQAANFIKSVLSYGSYFGIVDLIYFMGGEGGGVGISECWPKKNLAKTGHLKTTIFFWPSGQKNRSFLIHFRRKKEPTKSFC